jgi:hypothetical protein
MVNMVVHDMRNPSEAINNGLNQAQQEMYTQISDIMKEVQRSFKKYSEKINEIKKKDELKDLSSLRRKEFMSKSLKSQDIHSSK